MNTPNKSQLPQPIISPSAALTLPQVESGLSCRRVEDAIHAPTLAMSVRKFGEEHTVVLIQKAVVTGMAYFSEGQRLSPAQTALFTDLILDKYPHESLADVAVFMRRAALGTYGEEGYKGEVTKHGQTFGQLTLPRIMTWWKQYLGEKAEALENEKNRENGERKREWATAFHPDVLKVMDEAAKKAIEERAQEGVIARIVRLKGAYPDHDRR